MIHLSDTLHFDQTKVYQKPVEFKKLALPMEILLLLLFLFCSACANSPGQTSAMTAGSASERSANEAIELSDQPSSCGRQTYPKYVDVYNQNYVAEEIESGSAGVILHFHNLGQETLDAFLARTDGVLEVDSQWPDWGSISVVVNETGLRQLSQDCSIKLIEANKREYPQ